VTRATTITARTVKASCHRIALVTPIAGELRFVLTVGSGPKRYCASFGGTKVRDEGRPFRGT